MLAYYDSLCGLVPLRIVKLVHGADQSIDITATVTAPRGPYKRGETIHHLSGHRVVPRGAVFKKRGAGYQSIRPYNWREILPNGL